MNDERLREVYEQILNQRPASAAGDETPSPEQMLALVEGRGSDADRLRTLDRVMSSEDTRRDFELLRAAAAAARPRKQTNWRMLAAAAGVFIMAGVGTITWQRSRIDDNVLRGAGRAIRLAAPNDSPAASSPLVFVWHAVPGARTYEVELVEATGTLVHMTTVKDTTWVPPATTHLVPGVEYRWWVRATMPDGTTLEAPPRRLVLSP